MNNVLKMECSSQVKLFFLLSVFAKQISKSLQICEIVLICKKTK